jgi:hypothetical protein
MPKNTKITSFDDEVSVGSLIKCGGLHIIFYLHKKKTKTKKKQGKNKKMMKKWTKPRAPFVFDAILAWISRRHICIHYFIVKLLEEWRLRRFKRWFNDQQGAFFGYSTTLRTRISTYTVNTSAHHATSISYMFHYLFDTDQTTSPSYTTRWNRAYKQENVSSTCVWACAFSARAAQWFSYA